MNPALTLPHFCFKIHFNIFHPPTPMSSEWFIPFPTKILDAFFITPCLLHAELISSLFFILIIFGAGYQLLWSVNLLFCLSVHVEFSDCLRLIKISGFMKLVRWQPCFKLLVWSYGILLLIFYYFFGNFFFFTGTVAALCVRVMGTVLTMRNWSDIQYWGSNFLSSPQRPGRF